MPDDPAASPEAVSARVLVVDDDAAMRSTLAAVLEAGGYAVNEAGSGEVALAACRARAHDVVITDLHMPRMNGEQLVIALKAHDPDVEVLVLTGGATVESAVACMRLGAYDYLRKPCDPEELNGLVAKALEKRSLRLDVLLFEATRDLSSQREPAALRERTRRLADLLFDARARLVLSDDPAAEHPAAALALARRCDASALLEHGAGGCSLAVPVSAGSGRLGALVIERHAPFTAADVRRASVVAAQFALALENARMHRSLKDEVQRLTRRVVDGEKLALLGKVADSLAHEINNPMAALLSNLGWLEHLPAPLRRARALLAEKAGAHELDEWIEELPGLLVDCKQGAQRVADLVGALRDLRGPFRSGAPAVVSTGKAVRAALAGVTAEVELRELEDVPAYAVESDLAEALRALVQLASRAARAGGPTVVELGSRDRRPLVRIVNRSLALTPESAAGLLEPQLNVTAEAGGSRVALDMSVVLAVQRIRRNGGDLDYVMDQGAVIGFAITFLPGSSMGPRSEALLS